MSKMSKMSKMQNVQNAKCPKIKIRKIQYKHDKFYNNQNYYKIFTFFDNIPLISLLIYFYFQKFVIYVPLESPLTQVCSIYEC